MNINNVTCYVVFILFIICLIHFKTTKDCFISDNNNLIKFTHMLSSNIPSLFEKKYDVIVTRDFVSFSILSNTNYDYNNEKTKTKRHCDNDEGMYD